MIELRDITMENFWEVISLEVFPQQEDLVTSNAISIAQSKVQPECIPLAIYNEETPIGFIMYCIDRDDNEYWIYRIMIDKNYQGKGFGELALKLVLNRIKDDQSRNKVYLGVDKRGIESIRLYESFGFCFNGQQFGKEHIMVLRY